MHKNDFSPFLVSKFDFFFQTFFVCVITQLPLRIILMQLYRNIYDIRQTCHI